MSEPEHRQRTALPINGHNMEIIPEWEMGGGTSGVTLYCWTCDHEGAVKIKTCDFWAYPGIEHVYQPREAMIELRKQAWRHAHPERQTIDI